jgi:acyl dehydratase
MPVKASALGAKVDGRTVEATPRRLLAYAAGLGATDAIYMDDAAPGGIVAVPAFVVSLEWPVMGSDAYRAALGINAGERLKGVHVLQDSRFRRAIRPGDKLSTEGQIVSIRPTGAGAFVIAKLTTVDAGGALVAESFYGSIFRGVATDGGGGAIEEVPPLRAEAEVPGPGRATDRFKIAPELPHVYTECAAIWNPIHTERAVARAAGLPDIILHGTATWALACLAAIKAHGEGDPTRLRRFAGRFDAMVLPRTTIAVDHKRLDPRKVAVAVRTADDKFALSSGIAEIG